MIYEFTQKTLQEEIKKNGIIVLDFYATWCGPCKTFGSIFSEVARELAGVATFGKINIDEQRDLAVAYKITSIPSIIIIKQGEPVWAHVGGVSDIELTKKIKLLI